MAAVRGVILVGHGGIPKDCPQELVTKLKRMEAQRRAAKMPPSPEELELDTKIRQWPRTPETDPYQSGLEAVAAQLRANLGNVFFAVAYNEFCAPTLPDAVDQMIAAGVTDISIVPSMLTPGGVHSEIDIPESIAPLRVRHPQAVLRYAWPFDLEGIAQMIGRHLGPFLA